MISHIKKSVVKKTKIKIMNLEGTFTSY